MRVRFLADANFNQKIVAGLLLSEPTIDFALPQMMIPERMKDRMSSTLHIGQAASSSRTM